MSHEEFAPDVVPGRIMTAGDFVNFFGSTIGASTRAEANNVAVLHVSANGTVALASA